MMHDYQEINVRDKGIKFAEDGFTKLYEETVKTGIEYMADVKTATGKGILIGATGVGLAWLGASGINKIRRQNLKEVERVMEKSLREWESGR
jgi:hypothetical protein